MENYLKGWQDRRDVVIPPAEHQGFAEDVIIRRRVEPLELPGKEKKPADVRPVGMRPADVRSADEKSADERSPIGEVAAAVRTEKTGEVYTGEEATTLLEKPLRWRAYIRRIHSAEEVEINKSPFVIGKSVECDYVIKDNTTISRRHAQIITTGEGYMLEDLNSSNHTFIENIQVNGVERLKDRVEFQLSDEEFQFLLEIG